VIKATKTRSPHSCDILSPDSQGNGDGEFLFAFFATLCLKLCFFLAFFTPPPPPMFFLWILS
jgi:hypothetical protein